MSGSPIAKLAGCAVTANLPVNPREPWDHTYVTSSCGLQWGCFGRSALGRILDASSGSSIVANCLSQPNGKAGIRYLKTGVCHQAANRILFPTQSVTVHKANGYAISFMLFKTFGVGTWHSLHSCVYNQQPTPAQLSSTSDKWDVSMTTGDKYSSLFNKSAFTDAGHCIIDPREEILAFAEAKIGTPLDAATSHSLVTAAQKNRCAQEILLEQLDREEITASVYFTRIQDLLISSMMEYRKILETENFSKVFGEEFYKTGLKLDEAKFFEEHSKEKRDL